MMFLAVLAVTLGLVVASPVPATPGHANASHKDEPSKVEEPHKPFAGGADMNEMMKEFNQLIEKFKLKKDAGEDTDNNTKSSFYDAIMASLKNWQNSKQPLLPGWNYEEPRLPNWKSDEPLIPRSKLAGPLIRGWNYEEPRLLSWKSDEPLLPGSGFAEPLIPRREFAKPLLSREDSDEPLLSREDSDEPLIPDWLFGERN
ncbi:uncharacterized protein LOC122922590 [Bufo gargarizans]|uniref:uncharacterized protein LOC122922590 n=1 Tax=Bufo gargarizans TaxID=30331 RepID=UPI001CF5C1B4|nr:uncharacterized protein LOC122922590 [Bufo gargarizans]